MSLLSVFSAALILATATATSGVFKRDAKSWERITPEGVNMSIFENVETDAYLGYVNNSGVCETTPGVNQSSGYLTVGKNMSMWFWFFEARNDPESAPLALWLNGGPGCSSMIGLFQENGPCHFVDGQTEPTLNPYSWNEYANMLYIDQPVNVGFSYGTYTVNSTVQAAPYVWKFMQTFFAEFPQYKSREFGLFTESYGGHYGPEIARYFLAQNDRIDVGCVQGEKIDLVALGINNGLINPTAEFRTLATYAHDNPYKKILSDTDYLRILNAYYDLCLPAIANCTTLVGNDEACEKANDICNTQMWTNLMIASEVDFNSYDVRIGRDVEDPPRTYVDYITRGDIAKRIGAKTWFSECDNTVYEMMDQTGDGARSFLDPLSHVVKRNITTLIWAGDTDWICNWEGNFKAVNSIKWRGQDEFFETGVDLYTVNGESRGEYKTLDNLSWLKVYEAGHKVPYYQPELSLQVFKQMMERQPLIPT